jgi:hypothetical protein
MTTEANLTSDCLSKLSTLEEYTKETFSYGFPLDCFIWSLNLQIVVLSRSPKLCAVDMLAGTVL